ncbi:GtrA family protein [Paenibacillus sp. HB172176]|uniref:GtrA family protein n=1 Tax=Paenibacillus sp. HB172176 TaxID=2493690 RepID=UPI00143BB56A|nr:GtrA family protein [Paenibacillus sp. HB172176]
MSSMRNRPHLLQFIAFGFIGVLNTSVDFTVFALLNWLSVHYAVAQVCGYSAGMLNSYLLNSSITFRRKVAKDVVSVKRRSMDYKQALRFLLWNLMMLALSVALLAAVAQWLAIRPLLAKAVITVLIVFVNFYGSKKWVFAGGKAVETGGVE